MPTIQHQLIMEDHISPIGYIPIGLQISGPFAIPVESLDTLLDFAKIIAMTELRDQLMLYTLLVKHWSRHTPLPTASKL